MANPNDPLFTLDAAQSMAKLHAGAAEQVSKMLASAFVINTGIIKPQTTPDPKDIKDMTFDLSNTNGQYELGIARTDFKFRTPIDIEKNKVIQQHIKGRQKTENQIKSLTDPKAKSKQGDIEQHEDDIIAELKKYKLDSKVKVKYATDDEKNNKQKVIDAYKEAFKEENVIREQEFNDIVSQMRKDMVPMFQTYFKSFAGATHASRIREADIKWSVLAPDTKSIDNAAKLTKFNSFEIPSVTEQDYNKAFDEHQAKDPDGYIEMTICFKVAYEVEID